MRRLIIVTASLMACLAFPSMASAIDGQTTAVVAGQLTVDVADVNTDVNSINVSEVLAGNWTITENSVTAGDLPTPDGATCQWGADNHHISCNSLGILTSVVVRASQGNDTIMYSSTSMVPATLYGDAGNDFIRGGGGADLLYGDSAGPPGADGNDTLLGGCGHDSYLGGGGTDTVSFATDGCSAHNAGVTASLDNVGNDGIENENVGGNGSGCSIENLIGTMFNDTLTGDAAANQIDGQAGDDHLYGGAGNDYLAGGAGADHLYGGDGNDNIWGDAGQDVIYGDDPTPSAGEGADTISANDGEPDTINCNGGADAAILDNPGIDTVTNCEQTAFPIPFPPTSMVAPATPTGAAVVGETLTSTEGTWDGGMPLTITHAWAKCLPGAGCNSIVGATTPTYVVRTEDIGWQLKYTTHATNIDGAADANSPLTELVTAPAPPGGDGSCAAGHKSMKVGAVVICYSTSKALGGNRYELRGDVTFNDRIYLETSSPAQVDLKKLTVSVGGKVTIGVIWRGDRKEVYTANSLYVGDLSKVAFSLSLQDAVSQLSFGGIPFQGIDASGYLGSGSGFAPKLNVNVSTGTLTFSAGASLLNGALTIKGIGGFSAVNGPVVNASGCIDNLPIANASSHIVELHHACVSYDRDLDKWIFAADASLLQAVNAKANATLLQGGLESFGMSVNSGGITRLPLPFAAYADGGSFSIAGLRSGNFSVGGGIHGGWPYVPNPAGAELQLEGSVTYNASSRLLTIDGNGKLVANGITLSDGTIQLKLGLGTNYLPNTMNFNAHLDVFQGVISGDITASIDGAGWYAAAKVIAGFPVGADITNRVDNAIRTTGCDWWTIGHCPTVDGLEVSAEAVASNKGFGTRGTFGPVKASVWWLAATKQFDYDLGLTAKSLSFLKSRAVGADGRIRLARSTAAVPFDVPRGAAFVALVLEGSTTGNVVVRNPRGQVVADSSGPLSNGVDFGRDPLGSGKASMLLPVQILIAGTWTATPTGSPLFTKVTAMVSGDVPIAKIVKADKVGKGTRLVAGVSRMKIAWTAPAGTTVELRATNSAGTTSIPIHSGLARTGTLTWKVSPAWAGPMRIAAITVRSGLPTDSSTFARTFTVTRPPLTAPAKLKLKRAKGGSLIASWAHVKGAARYDIQTYIGRAKSGGISTVTNAHDKLTLRSRATIGVRVRAVSKYGLVGRWSRVQHVAAVPVHRKKPATHHKKHHAKS